MKLIFTGLAIALIAGSAACVRAGSTSAPNIDIASLNKRIEHAVSADSNWPKTPGGLAGKLFGLRAMVLPREALRLGQRVAPTTSNIVFPGSHLGESVADSWLEADILKTADGTWRVQSISICEEARAAEAETGLEERRERSKKLCGLDFVTQGPLDCLEILKARDKPLLVHPTIPADWVSEADLPALVNMLDSDEPCAGVINMLSSRIDTTHSTVGNQAAYLIEGFRKDRYPPGLLTTLPYDDIEELKRWWRERSGS